jgi:SnoaL-like domain
MARSAFRAAVEAQDIDAAVGLLAEDAVFNSPAVHKPYEGREAVATILRAAYSVFEDFHYVDELHGDGVEALIFRANVGDRQVQGLDLVRTDAEGRITEFTVMLRPATGLMAVAERMGAKLAEAGIR